MVECTEQAPEAEVEPNYIIGKTNMFRRAMASLGLAKPRWDPEAKARWEANSEQGDERDWADAPPGYVREFVNKCLSPADAAREIARYTHMM